MTSNRQSVHRAACPRARATGAGQSALHTTVPVTQPRPTWLVQSEQPVPREPLCLTHKSSRICDDRFVVCWSVRGPCPRDGDLAVLPVPHRSSPIGSPAQVTRCGFRTCVTEAAPGVTDVTRPEPPIPRAAGVRSDGVLGLHGRSPSCTWTPRTRRSHRFDAADPVGGVLPGRAVRLKLLPPCVRKPRRQSSSWDACHVTRPPAPSPGAQTPAPSPREWTEP